MTVSVAPRSDVIRGTTTPKGMFRVVADSGAGDFLMSVFVSSSAEAPVRPAIRQTSHRSCSRVRATIGEQRSGGPSQRLLESTQDSALRPELSQLRHRKREVTPH